MNLGNPGTMKLIQDGKHSSIKGNHVHTTKMNSLEVCCSTVVISTNDSNLQTCERHYNSPSYIYSHKEYYHNGRKVESGTKSLCPLINIIYRKRIIIHEWINRKYAYGIAKVEECLAMCEHSYINNVSKIDF